MKQIELELKKRLLIVKGDFMAYHNGRPLKLLCKGSELTEEIANTYVSDHNFYDENRGRSYHGYKDYKHNDYALQSALESFISAIEAKGYYWVMNPNERPIEDRTHYAKWQINAFKQKLKQFEEAESKTFNPEKTLIFEIL